MGKVCFTKIFKSIIIFCHSKINVIFNIDTELSLKEKVNIGHINQAIIKYFLIKFNIGSVYVLKENKLQPELIFLEKCERKLNISSILINFTYYLETLSNLTLKLYGMARCLNLEPGNFIMKI